MSRPTDPVAHWEDLENWLSAMTHNLLPNAADSLGQLTQDQLDDCIANLIAQDPTTSYGHKELAKITGSLSHTLIGTLKLTDKQAALLQKDLTQAQRRIDQLELEAQDRQEGTDETEQNAKEEIKTLKQTLESTTQELEQAKAAQEELDNKLQYARESLEKANTDFRSKNTRIKALENHLEKSRNEISNLVEQLYDMREESDTIREELKHAYELRFEPTRTRVSPVTHSHYRETSPSGGMPYYKRSEAAVLKTSPADSEEKYPADKRKGRNLQADYEAAHGLPVKHLDKIARNINKFTPSVTGSQDVKAYLQDIDFHLEARDKITDRDRLDLLRTTSSPEVRSFLDRQPAHTKSDYHLLRQSLIKEFADPEADQGLVAALEIKQGRQERPITTDSDGHILGHVMNLTWKRIYI